MPAAHRDIELRLRFWDRVPVRLGAGVVLIASAALALALWLVNAQEERQFERERVAEAAKVATLIASDLARQMQVGGGAAVWSAVSAEAVRYVGITGTLRILVLNRDGLVKSASESAAQGSRIEVRRNPQCPKCDSDRAEDFPAAGVFALPGGARMLRIVSRIPATPACSGCHESSGSWRGLIAVDFDLTALERGTAQRRWSVLAVGLVTGLLLTALISLLFRELVMRSIAALARTARRLADGDLTARTEVLGRNELGLLARHFNRMANRIDDQVHRIEAAQMESSLLYTLVVESAKSLETADMAAGVFRVILERLRPDHVAFFLDAADGHWICAATVGEPGGAVTRGEGDLETALTSTEEPVAKLLGGMDPDLVADACRTRTLRMLHDGGGLTFALPLVCDAKLVGMLACVVDSATFRVQQDMLEHLGANLALAAANARNYSGAITDPLTRLRNKRYGMLRLDEAVYAAKRYRSGLALAMCDIDFFKRVNDTHGHPAGDAVLKEVARRLAAVLRRADVAVRYGGEEFMVILPQANAEEIVAIGEKMRESIAVASIPAGTAQGPIAVTLSVGIAAFRVESDTAESLLARADAALYRAKEGGRNRVEVDA